MKLEFQSLDLSGFLAEFIGVTAQEKYPLEGKPPTKVKVMGFIGPIENDRFYYMIRLQAEEGEFVEIGPIHELLMRYRFPVEDLTAFVEDKE